MCKVVAAIVGALFGVVAGGALEVFVTLVFPHGGWNHVPPQQRFKLFACPLVGLIVGVVAGAMFDTGIRTGRAKFYYAGAVLAPGLFWPYVFVLVAYVTDPLPEIAARTSRTPLLTTVVNVVPFLMLAAFVIARERPGMAFWFAAIPTVIYAFWLHGFTRFYATDRGSLLGSLIGTGIMLVGVAMGLCVERVWGSSQPKASA